MAYRDASSDRREARRYFVELGITNISRLSKLVSVPERTLIRWRDTEKWAEQKSASDISPAAIAKIYLQNLRQLLQAIAERKKDADDAYITPREMKELAFYRKELRAIDADFDIQPTMLVFVNGLIDFVIELPQSDFTDKRSFFKDLQNILPRYLATFDDKSLPSA
jgi:hypothetical protein